MFSTIYEIDGSAIICGEIIDITDLIDRFNISVEYIEYHQNVKKAEKVRTKFIIHDVCTINGEHTYVNSFRRHMYKGEFRPGSIVLMFVRFGDILHIEGRAYSIKEYGEVSFGQDSNKYAVIGEIKKMVKKVSAKTGQIFLQTVLYTGLRSNVPEEVIVNIFGDTKIFMATSEIDIGDKVCFKSEMKPYVTEKNGTKCYWSTDYMVVNKKNVACSLSCQKEG